MTKDLRSYTTVDVAKRLGVSLQTVQRWVDAGHLRAWKTLGGHRRIEAASAEILFREQEERIGVVAACDADSADLAPPSVVVVDDDAVDRTLMVGLVLMALPNAAISEAANGFQGLVAIGRTAPRIVITDFHMPNMNGFEMIRNVLQDTESRPRKLMVVSALSRQEIATLDTLPPEVEFFTKPLDPERFAAALRTAL